MAWSPWILNNCYCSAVQLVRNEITGTICNTIVFEWAYTNTGTDKRTTLKLSGFAYLKLICQTFSPFSESESIAQPNLTWFNKSVVIWAHVFNMEKRKMGLKLHEGHFHFWVKYSFKLLFLLNCCIANCWCCSCSLKSPTLIENEWLPVTLSQQVAASMNAPLAFAKMTHDVITEKFFMFFWSVEIKSVQPIGNLSSLALSYACTHALCLSLSNL